MIVEKYRKIEGRLYELRGNAYVMVAHVPGMSYRDAVRWYEQSSEDEDDDQQIQPPWCR